MLGRKVVATRFKQWTGSDPVWLVPAVKLAKLHHAKLLFVDITRAVRGPDREQLPRASDRDELDYWLDGVQVETLLPDDMTVIKSFKAMLKKFDRHRAALAQMMYAAGATHRDVMDTFGVTERACKVWKRKPPSTGGTELPQFLADLMREKKPCFAA